MNLGTQVENSHCLRKLGCLRCPGAARVYVARTPEFMSSHFRFVAQSGDVK